MKSAAGCHKALSILSARYAELCSIHKTHLFTLDGNPVFIKEEDFMLSKFVVLSSSMKLGPNSNSHSADRKHQSSDQSPVQLTMTPTF